MPHRQLPVGWPDESDDLVGRGTDPGDSVALHSDPSPPDADRWGSTRPGGRALLITDDAGLLDDVLRMAAVAGVEIDLASHPGAIRASWSSAPLVLVGADMAVALAASMPTRRAGVVVVVGGATEDDRSPDAALERPVWRAAVALGAEDVITLPTAEAWLAGRIADAGDGPELAGRLVAVVAGRGGAGASTVAVALARRAAGDGLTTLLVDADRWGGGLDLLLGGEDVPGLRWPDLVDTRGRVSGSALRHALPQLDGVTLLSWDRGDPAPVSAEAMVAVLQAGARGFDLTVIDLARSTEPAVAEAVARADDLVLVVPAEVRAVAAAAAVHNGLLGGAAHAGLVVRAVGGALTTAAVVEALSLPLWAELGDERGLAAAVDRGEPPGGRRRGPVATASRALLAGLGLTNGVAA